MEDPAFSDSLDSFIDSSFFGSDSLDKDDSDKELVESSSLTIAAASYIFFRPNGIFCIIIVTFRVNLFSLLSDSASEVALLYLK